jgi:hypothetical protein
MPAFDSAAERRLLLWAAAAGVLYGLLVRVFFGWNLGGDLFPVVSVAFLFLLPFALGFLVVALGERRQRWPWYLWLIVPWAPALLTLGAALLLAWEGLICIVLWVPLFMVLSSAGGLCAAVWRLLFGRRGGAGVVAGCLLLPAVAAPLESRLEPRHQTRTVSSAILIRAQASTVWRHIANVERIAPAEQGFAWNHLIGFPRPLEALSLGEGVGAVRHARFEGGVLFVETVTRWEPGRALAFSIAADPESIPAQTLDPHVTVGGPYFDVLEGEYRIEPLAEGVRLHLRSRHRLSTHFNLYSGMWTDFILADIQRHILEILRRRCEAEATGG